MKNNKIHGKNYEKFLKLTALNNLYEYLLKMKIIKIKKVCQHLIKKISNY